MMGKNPVNKEMDMKLIALVKAHPLLYNPKNSHHQDSDSREVVWQKIGDILNRPPKACKSRWVNMRDIMRKRYRMLRDGKRSASYKYEAEMSFMLPYFAEKDSNTTDAIDYEQDFLDTDAEQNDEFNSTHFLDKDIKPIYNDDYVTKEFSTTDSIDVFLLSVGSTLRKLSPYYLNQAKSKIFQIVQDYELKQIMDKDNNSVPGTSGECSTNS